MRLPTTIAAVLLATSFVAFAYKTETLQELIARAEAAKVDDRPALYVEIAERQLKSADGLYTAGKTDDARTAVQDVVTYWEKAHDAAIQSGKRLKNTEIDFRKMAAKLRDLKRSLNFEDQAPVQAAADRLENFRTGTCYPTCLARANDFYRGQSRRLGADNVAAVELMGTAAPRSAQSIGARSAAGCRPRPC